MQQEQANFFSFILDYYVRNGFTELAMDKLKDFINIKYNSMQDAKQKLQMTAQDIRYQYIALQEQLDLSMSGFVQKTPGQARQPWAGKAAGERPVWA